MLAALAISFPTASNEATAIDSRRARTLYGVSVGEDARTVLARLGLAPPRSAPASGVPANTKRVAEYRVFLADQGRALIGLGFDARIRVVVAHPNGSRSSSVADAFGIRLGDSRQRLTKKRGRPDAISRGEYVYGDPSGLHWFYALEREKVAAIGVSDQK